MNYRTALRASAPLLTAVPIFGLATGALFPIVALRLQELGGDPAFIGLATTLYYCGSFLAALLFGRVLKRVGHRSGFAISALFAAAASFSLTLTNNEVAWLALRFIGGFSLGAYYVVVDGWFQALADRRSRGKLFATYETVRLAATAGGPFLLVLGSTMSSLWLVSLAYIISVVPALFAQLPEQRTSKPYRFQGLAGTFRCFPAALIIAACGGAANATFYGLSAIYASAIGLTPGEIAVFVAIVLVAPSITQIPLGALADRYTRMQVATGCAAAAILGCSLLILWASPTLWVVCAAGVLVGGAMVPMYAFGLSRIVDHTESADVVQATSAGLLAYNGGAFAGPVLAGSTMMLLGPTGLYAFLLAIAAIALVASISDTRFSRCCQETSLA